MDIANYADDSKPYATANDIDSLIASLVEASKYLFTWFGNNLLKINAEKCHLLVSSNEKVTIKIGSHEIGHTKREKLLGVHLDSGLSFDYHVIKICKNASHKVCTLARVTPGMSLTKKCTHINAFFKSQFDYCPLIRMCHSRENNKNVKRRYKRYLRIIYNDYPLFESIFIGVLNTHTRVATKKVLANNHQFMTKALRKAIMTRSRF